MRGTVVGLPTPYPLSGLLPAFLQEDDFTVRLTQGFDDVVAPLISVLDCLDAYVDPLLAPPDFVPWLAAWVGATVDEHWADLRTRQSVLAASSMHRQRGTVDGLRSQLALATGGDVQIEDAGEVRCSVSPTGDDDQTEPSLAIRIAVDDPGSVRVSVLEELVDGMKPAHVPHVIEVVSR